MQPAALLHAAYAFSAVMAVAQPGSDLPIYVGGDRCAGCHSATGVKPDCSIPAVPQHERAYSALNSDAAREIAFVSGEPSAPTASLICIGCHATGAEEGPRWMDAAFDLTAGIQCEACHGAGSLHAEQPRDFPLHRADHTVCDTCHRSLPSHDLVLREGWRRAPQDRCYKTPVALAFSPDGRRLYVVCNQSNSVVVIDPQSRTVVGEVPVQLRPTGIAVAPDGKRIFVTNRLSDTVSVIDADLTRPVVHWIVGDEPHGLLATEELLLVLNTGEDSISVLDSTSGVELRRLPAGCGPWDLALRPDGSAVTTSVRPQPARFQQPHHSELTILDCGQGYIRERYHVADANMLKGIASVPSGPHRGVTLFTLLRTKNLVPTTRLQQGWVITSGLGVLHPDGSVDQVLLDEPVDGFADPEGIAISPDGRFALVTSGGTDRIAVVDIDQLMATIVGCAEPVRREVLPDHLGVSQRFVVQRLPAGANPRGIAFTPDGRQAWVANALADSLTIIETASWQVAATLALGDGAEASELRRGARLFHSADISFGRQFSCQSCHPDGHINGLSMDIEADGIGLKPVDNRTLRGIIDTGPFKWEGTNPSLARQCGARLAVFFTRREPFTPAELQALVRYECTIERPPNRHRQVDGLTPAQYRGKLIFERTRTNDGEIIAPMQRCTACHNGPYKTAQNRTRVRTTTWFDSWVNLPLAGESMFDSVAYGDLGIFYFADAGVPAELLDAPHLNNLYDSAPYLHSGAAATLEEIWTRYNYVGGHGATADLTRRQYNDLIAYLRTL